MADVKNDEEENTLPAKRKSDLCFPEKVDDDLKKKQQKLQTFADSKSASEEVQKKAEEDLDVEEDYESDDDEDGDDMHSNGKPEIDRKGKGIMVEEDKGKGKLIEDSDDSSDDDDDDDSSESDDDSDLSDDPLAEVDLDNILPSRTRRRSVLPGIHISNDAGNNGNGDDDDDDDDDSDDSDA